jgi:hypothetical protein
LLWATAPVAQQELAEAMSRSQLIPLGCLSCAYEIAKGLVGPIGNPNRCELPRPVTPRQLDRVAAIRLDPVSSFHRD